MFNINFIYYYKVIKDLSELLIKHFSIANNEHKFIFAFEISFLNFLNK